MTENPIAFSSREGQEIALDLVRTQMQKIINDAGISSSEGLLDQTTPLTITTPMPYPSHSLGKFIFRGCLSVPRKENGYSSFPGFEGMPVAVIEHIRIPPSFIESQARLGTRIVEAWEDAWRILGVTTFAAKGVLDKARPFWVKKGYETPTQGLRLDLMGFPYAPRYMIKQR